MSEGAHAPQSSSAHRAATPGTSDLQELLGCAPGEMDCETVLGHVWLFLDDECDPEQRAELQRHLDGCSPCLERFGIEEQLKEMLARKCGGDHAPDGLRTRLRSSLRDAVAEGTNLGAEGAERELRDRAQHAASQRTDET